METQKIWLDDTLIDIGADFLREIRKPNIESRMKGHVFISEHKLWIYKKTTTMRLYWLNKKTWIHKLVEIKWQSYLHEGLNYPNTCFSYYLLTQKWGAQFYPDTVETEIKIWFGIRNKILQ